MKNELMRKEPRTDVSHQDRDARRGFAEVSEVTRLHEVTMLRHGAQKLTRRDRTVQTKVFPTSM